MKHVNEIGDAFVNVRIRMRGVIWHIRWHMRVDCGAVVNLNESNPFRRSLDRYAPGYGVVVRVYQDRLASSAATDDSALGCAGRTEPRQCSTVRSSARRSRDRRQRSRKA